MTAPHLLDNAHLLDGCRQCKAGAAHDLYQSVTCRLGCRARRLRRSSCVLSRLPCLFRFVTGGFRLMARSFSFNTMLLVR
jgi:hypothetical protein